MQIRQAERDLESCSIAKSSSSSSKNSSNPQSVADQSLKKVNVQLPVYSSDCNKTNKKFTTVSTSKEISTWSTPLVLGEKTISLGTFDGKKESWLRFFQTFKAVVDKQPYDPMVKFAILEKTFNGPCEGLH